MALELYQAKTLVGDSKESVTATAEYDFGDDISQAIELFGEEKVFNIFKC